MIVIAIGIALASIPFFHETDGRTIPVIKSTVGSLNSLLFLKIINNFFFLDKKLTKHSY